MEEKRKYYYRDYLDPGNNVVVTSLVQVSKRCGLSPRRIGQLLSKGNMYCDPEGRFYIERVLVLKDDSKSRRGGNVGNLVSFK